jgi:hypothetical protein
MMADRELLDTYLNDHLAGAKAGVDLANEIAEDSGDTPLAAEMTNLATDIEADRQSLVEIMDALGIEKETVKQAIGWMAEKMSRLRLNRAAAGSEELSLLLSIEALSMGVEAKRSLWQCLAQVAPSVPGLSAVELSTLEHRAEDQIARLVAARTAVAGSALAPVAPE